MEKLKSLIKEAIREIINEGRYDVTPTPHNSHTDVQRNLGLNPLYADNGGHSAQDVVSQVSTIDTNGENFNSNGNNLVVTDNKFIIYKIKNFGNDKIESTLSLFGKGAYGEKELRRAIDTINGAAGRNGRSIKYRTITSVAYQAISKRTEQMAKTFWEFSLDGGHTWYILKPNPIQSMQLSKLIVRTDESKRRRITEAADDEFSLQELSSIPSFNGRLNYCKEHLGPTIGRGSSRVVFQVDDEKCLKLAMNQKGVAQNEVEIDWYKQTMDCFPKIFENDSNNQWIVCEYVLPAKTRDFEHCLGLTFSEFCDFVMRCFKEYSRRPVYARTMDDKQFYELLESNMYLTQIYDYMTNYNAPVGDLLRIVNYGMVRRNGEDIIVILDHGLTDEVFNKYYR